MGSLRRRTLFSHVARSRAAGRGQTSERDIGPANPVRVALRHEPAPGGGGQRARLGVARAGVQDVGEISLPARAETTALPRGSRRRRLGASAPPPRDSRGRRGEAASGRRAGRPEKPHRRAEERQAPARSEWCPSCRVAAGVGRGQVTVNATYGTGAAVSPLNTRRTATRCACLAYSFHPSRRRRPILTSAHAWCSGRSRTRECGDSSSPRPNSRSARRRHPEHGTPRGPEDAYRGSRRATRDWWSRGERRGRAPERQQVKPSRSDSTPA